MKLFYRKKTVDNEQKAGGGFHLPLWSFLQQNIQIVFVFIFSLSAVCFAVSYFSGLEDDRELENQQTTLQEDMQTAAEIYETTTHDNTTVSTVSISAIEKVVPTMLPEYDHVEDGRFVVVGKRIK